MSKILATAVAAICVTLPAVSSGQTVDARSEANRQAVLSFYEKGLNQ